MNTQLQKWVSYANYKGGVNNLQIVKVVRPSPYNGLVNILKTFTSQKHQAIKRADRFINSYPF